MAKEKKRTSDKLKTLRQQAEEQSGDTLSDIRNMTSADLQRLVHELRIHQIELELQNEELRTAQVELAESHDRYSDLYEFAPVGYVTVNKRGTIVECNGTAAAMLGVNRHALLQMNIQKFVASECQDEWFLHRRATLSSGTKQTCEIRMHNAAGSPLWVRVESVAFGSPKNEVQCQTALIDISERKKAEQHRERLLHREQEARREAEEANAGKDLFLAVVSHELRTPLTSILGWSRLLLDRNLEGARRSRALESIENNARMQAQLIEDLLDVSAMLAGNIRLNLQSVDLSKLVIDAIDVVCSAADAKSIQIHTQFDGNIGSYSCDAQRLQQVAWNLLSNAIKFTPSGGHIDVRLQRRDSDVLLVVSDNGNGIPKEFLPHMFDPFRQADASSIRKHGGLGLGLAIVRHIVGMHGGSVHAASAGQGTGASFTVRLPFNAACPPEQPARVNKDIFKRVTNHSALDQMIQIRGLRILVVDDEAAILEMLKTALEHCDAKVRTSVDVAGALKVFRQWKPDILISDIAMPSEDGYALIAKVRELEKPLGHYVVAVALTAYVRVEERARVLDAGFDSFVPKPVEPDELVAALAEARRRVRPN